MLVPTVAAIVTDENLRENYQCFPKPPSVFNEVYCFLNNTTVHNNTEITVTIEHNSFEERRIALILLRLDTSSRRPLC